MSMSVQEVADAVEEVRKYADDDPKAHSLEDNLWQGVLETIAEGGTSLTSAMQMCQIALTTKDIEFARWRD